MEVIEMKTCPNCGQSMEDDEVFCASCGTKVETPAPAPAGGFCPNCGEAVGPEDLHCPNCGCDLRTGAAPAAESAPARRSKAPVSHRKVGIAAACVAVVLVGALLVTTVGGAFAPAHKKFIRYNEELLLDQMVGGVVKAAELYNEKTTFSTDMTLTASGGGSEIAPYLKGSAVDLKVDMNKDKLLLGAGLTLMGSPIVDGTLTYEKGVLGAYVPALSDSYYTVDLVELAAQTMGEELPALDDIEVPQIPTAELKKVAETYIKTVLGVVNKDNVTKEKGTIRMVKVGERTEGEIYTFRPTAEDVEQMLLDLADLLESDGSIHDLAEKFMGQNQELVDQMLAESGYYASDVLGELDDAMVKAAEGLRESAWDAGKAVEASGFTWTLYVKGGKVCRMAIEMPASKSGAYFETAKDGFAFWVESYGSEEASLVATWKESGGAYTGRCTLSADGESMSVRFDEVQTKKTSILGYPYGTYTITMPDDAGSMTMKVSAAQGGGSDHTFSMYIPDGYSSELNDLEIVLHTTDKKSTISKPKAKVEDLTGYTEEDFQDLYSRLEGQAQGIVMDIYSAMAGF